jgi:hypothetical protein
MDTPKKYWKLLVWPYPDGPDTQYTFFVFANHALKQVPSLASINGVLSIVHMLHHSFQHVGPMKGCEYFLRNFIFLCKVQIAMFLRSIIKKLKAVNHGYLESSNMYLLLWREHGDESYLWLLLTCSDSMKRI